MEMLRIRKEVIDDNVVRSLKRTALNVSERISQGIKILKIDAPDGLDRIIANLQNCRRDYLDMWQLAQDIRVLNRYRGAAKALNHRRARGTHHGIGPYCSGA